MARHEEDREDLMREATALRRRVELTVPESAETLVAGFRDTGGLSLFFGADPALHFDAEGRLRRAYVGGCLYRTQGETLAQLTRIRSASRSELRRHDLTVQELAAFRETLQRQLQGLHDALKASACRVVECIPADWRFDKTLLDSLEEILATDIRLAPRIPGKR